MCGNVMIYYFISMISLMNVYYVTKFIERNQNCRNISNGSVLNIKISVTVMNMIVFWKAVKHPMTYNNHNKVLTNVI